MVWLPRHWQPGRMLPHLLGLLWFSKNVLQQLLVVVRATGIDVRARS